MNDCVTAIQIKADNATNCLLAGILSNDETKKK